jgi:hypothetical protein
MTSIVVIGDKLGDMQQSLLDRLALIEAEKEAAASRQLATATIQRDAHNAYIAMLDEQAAAIKELIGG